MNKPIAWITEWKFKGEDCREVTFHEKMRGNSAKSIPLYTQDQLEEARKLGMQQERALWNLSESTQEIMNPYKAITDTKIEQTVVSYTHPVELTDEEMMKAEYEFMYWNRSLEKPLVEIAYELGVFKQAVAILRKASEK